MLPAFGSAEYHEWCNRPISDAQRRVRHETKRFFQGILARIEAGEVPLDEFQQYVEQARKTAACDALSTDLLTFFHEDYFYQRPAKPEHFDPLIPVFIATACDFLEREENYPEDFESTLEERCPWDK